MKAIMCIGVRELKINKVDLTKSNVCIKNTTTPKSNQNNKNLNQITELSNICYKPISFGRSEKEHKSWGAVIDPKTKETSFKLFTYPDTKGVTVTVEKPNNPNHKKVYELWNKGNGVFETPGKIPAGEVKPGDKYYFTIYKGNGAVDSVKDPYSFRQQKLLGESVIYDQSKYKWKDENWFKSSKERISRRANAKNGLKSLNEAVIYELNIPTFTKEGTFNTAKKKLKSIKNQGFNAIEIMPVENTNSPQWGYDGVDKFAPAEHLGGPDGLKSLVDYAHNIGLNVIMDMVPNHLGPDGASLIETGPYIKGPNQFGGAFNYEGQNSKYVRDYIVNAALNWLDNYHCDGLRLDMTKFMESDYTMKQIAAEINYHKPDAFLIAEDAREKVSTDDNGNYWHNEDEVHDKRVMTPLKSFETGEGESEKVHCEAIDKISESNTSIGRLGYDSEWDFNYFHALNDGIYGSIDLDKFEKICYCAQDRVKYVMSHDEIGNHEGTRLAAKLMKPMLHLEENIVLNNNDIERAKKLSEIQNKSLDEAMSTVKQQKADFASETLAIMLLTGKLDKYNTTNINSRQFAHNIDKSFKNEILTPLGIKHSSGINYQLIKEMFKKSMNKCEMAIARTYSIPGPTMVFQGDEKADLTPFRFFREFEYNPSGENINIEKGYDTGKKGQEISTLGNIPYSKEGIFIMNKFNNILKDLNRINAENPALTKGRLIPESSVKHYPSQVFATHCADAATNNEIYCITNFNDSNYPSSYAADYYIKFPKGKWVEILNTDDTKYNGSGHYKNTNIIESDGINNIPVKLAGYSTYMFKKIE